MAIPNNYIDKITNKDSGESRIISPAADMVRVENENYEGSDLDEVLDEVAQAIEDAGSGYEPPQGGIPKQDLTQSVQDSLELADSSLQPSDKTQLQGAITQLQNALNTLIGSGNVQGAIDTFNEVVAFLNGIDTDDPTLFNQLKSLSDAITGLQTTLSQKANDNVVVKSISVNGTAQTKDGNGNVNIQVQGGNGNVSVIQPDPADGTFIIRVGDTDYTINLNHQHPEYAPLVHTHTQYAQVQVVNGESNLPDPLDPKTIYGVKAGGVDELEMVVIGGYKFYGGGGTPGQPVLMQPAPGSSISMGIVDNGPLDNVLDPKSKAVYIKARNITQPINVSVSGTGFIIENSVSQISAADARTGVNINVLFDGSASSQGGTLVLQSTELGSAYIDLTVEYVAYELLDAVGLRGTQWIETDYLVNPNTNLKVVWQFTPNSNTRQMGTKNYIIDSKIDHTTSVFMVYFGNNASENNAGTYMLNVATDGKVSYNSYYQQLRFNTNNNPDATFCNKGTFVYSGTSASFNDKSITMVRQTRTANNGMLIGIKDVDGETPVNAFDIDIYSLEITEGETVVRSYIPVKKNGVPGLYDTVYGTFHTSASGTPLAEITSNNS